MTSGAARTTIVLVLMILPASARQGEPPGLIDKWITEPGGYVEVTGPVLAVRSGTARTVRVYSDFAFRFEYRQPESAAEGRVFVRARFGYGARELGYRIALTNGMDDRKPLGRISAAEVGMKETGSATVRPTGTPGSWQECEIRAERDRLSVRVNGVIVSSAENLDEFGGYIALQAERGTTEFRNLRIEALPTAGEPFGLGAFGFEEPGLTPPRAVRRAKPFYPREVQQARIQGVVGLEVVIDVTGRVQDVRVVRPLHPDLDEAAISSARQWRFAPGTKSGQQVPVVATMDIEFRLSR